MIVYIAGPYRAEHAYAVEKNVRRAEELAYEVAVTGHTPLCPHSMTRFFDGTLTDQRWLDITLELLGMCDAVLVAPGYETSEGTLGEIEAAEKWQQPVFYTLEALKEYYNEPTFP